MRNDDTIEQLKKEIEQLTIRIELLEFEKDQRERSGEEQVPRNHSRDAVASNRPSATQPTRRFRVGDRVKVTNNYRGQRGLEGTVVSVTQHWVHFETDSLGVRKRSHHNLVRID